MDQVRRREILIRDRLGCRVAVAVPSSATVERAMHFSVWAARWKPHSPGSSCAQTCYNESSPSFPLIIGPTNDRPRMSIGRPSAAKQSR